MAAARQPVMLALMRENPWRALDQSLRWHDWVGLPKDIQALVEEPFSEIGDLEVIFDSPTLNQGQELSRVYRIAMRGTSFHAFVYGYRSRMTSKAGIPLQGIILGGEVALWESPAMPLDTDDLASALQRFPEGNARGYSCLTVVPKAPRRRQP